MNARTILPRLILFLALSGAIALAVLNRDRLDPGSQQTQIQSLGIRAPLGRIPDARNIPLSDLPARIEELESSQRCRVTLVCRTDKRSAQPAALLEKADFAGVAVLRGGTQQWKHAGFEIVRESNT
jgi:rhodanese-related sulfurtransferase